MLDNFSKGLGFALYYYIGDEIILIFFFFAFSEEDIRVGAVKIFDGN